MSLLIYFVFSLILYTLAAATLGVWSINYLDFILEGDPGSPYTMTWEEDYTWVLLLAWATIPIALIAEVLLTLAAMLYFLGKLPSFLYGLPTSVSKMHEKIKRDEKLKHLNLSLIADAESETSYEAEAEPVDLNELVNHQS